ncbi:hypothetical protein JL720_15608 [Aureococcus anophagefferens]|nr:hypothetical protein JL720_15608 [Aureococcus anophagefferens]
MEKYDPANDEVPFMEMGVDSMGLTDFVNQLNSALGIELPEVALFEYPTVSDLRKALITMVLELQGGGDDSDSDDDGMGRLPLDRAHSPLTPTGLEGLDLPHTATYGGFIQTKHWIDFDGDFFGVAVAEAKVMDPQQRQLMEVGFEALDAAGITKQAIRAHDDAWTVGNFVALQTNDFARAIVRSPRLMHASLALALDQAPKLTLTNVETHGTGTALGDPIEMAALASHAEKPAKLAAPIVLSGVKAYLGHLEPAAGFAGVAAPGRR